MSTATTPQNAPLRDLEQWDEFLEGRYREGKSKEEFRQYDATANPGVAEFYRLNHENQTVDYVLGKEKQYFGLNKGGKTVWEAAEFLNTLVDDSDPDSFRSTPETRCPATTRSPPETYRPPRPTAARHTGTGICPDRE